MVRSARTAWIGAAPLACAIAGAVLVDTAGAQRSSGADAPAADTRHNETPPPSEGAPRADRTSEQPATPIDAVHDDGSRADATLDELPAYGAVAIVPTAGARQPLRRVPRNVRLVDADQLTEGAALGAHDGLHGRLASVVINDVQNNPLQPDVQYRGHTASPLLGSPQGLSIYQHGVRINEPFGEVVQWDLVPTFAIDELQVIPGSNPLYGLNALGGSLALHLKNGLRNPGPRARVLAGSFGRGEAVVEHGISNGGWALYTGASAFGEDGFRDASPSRATLASIDGRHVGAAHAVGVNLTLADTELYGNGPTPVELLAEDRASLFTYPDITRNELVLPVVDARVDLSDAVAVQATLYLRRLQRDTLNGDEAQFDLCTANSGAQLLCDEDGDPAVGETGEPIPAPVDGQAYDGLFNTSSTTSTGAGGAAQVLLERDLAGHANQLVVGGSYDGAAIEFSQRAELGMLTPQRSISGRGVFVGDDEFRTDLDVQNHHFGIYASDTFDVTPRLAASASARLNHALIDMNDQLGQALDGEHAFTRINPAFGLAYSPVDALTVFAGYAEANRVPSAAELACADPDAPCRLPNAFVADPPLQQVVNRSVELGVRGQHGNATRPALRWSLAGHAARSEGDILFVAGSRVGTGYFRNAGDTQRMGIEADATARVDVLEVFVSYALLHATYESALALPGGAHPKRQVAEGSEDSEGAFIQVSPGDRVPGLPAHSARLGILVRATDRWRLGLSARGQSSQYLRGDEANLLSPLRGFVVVGAQSSYRLLDTLTLLVQARNLLDARYETFGVVADPSEVLPALSTPRFVSPGAPLGVWVGLQVDGR